MILYWDHPLHRFNHFNFGADLGGEVFRVRGEEVARGLWKLGDRVPIALRGAILDHSKAEGIRQQATEP